MKKPFYKRILTTAKNLNNDYIEIIRTNSSDFTRKRKVTIEDLFLQMLANKGKSQKSEIHDFYEDVNKQMEVSQTAFYNARMKFKPEALLSIMKDLTAEEYAEPEDLVTLNGYYIMAVDGSDFIFPSTDENREKFGTPKNKTNTEMPVMSSISTYFDCINKLFLDIQINEYRYPERASASEHLMNIQNMIPSKAKYLTIFDRGYAGIELIIQMLEANQKFVMRLSKNAFKREQMQLTDEENDQWIDIEYDRTRTNKYRADKSFRMKLMNSKFHLRFIQISQTSLNGKITTSTFLTNLTNQEFDTNGMEELYHLRWNIETSYRSLKSQLNVEEFSGYREVLIKQDIYAGAFVYNAVSMTIAENEKVKEVPEDRYKYEMKTNRNFAIGVLKKDLLKMFILYKNKKAVKQAQTQFENNIVKYSCPIRKNREPKRKKKGFNKSKLSYRRSY